MGRNRSQFGKRMAFKPWYDTNHPKHPDQIARIAKLRQQVQEGMRRYGREGYADAGKEKDDKL